jgi:hypothetical protein
VVSDEVLPRPGVVVREGKHVELDEDAVKKEVEAARDAWKKAHPGSDEKGGPYPFRSAVTVRRQAAEVPQTLRVDFEDGTTENVSWPAGERWHRFTFERATKVASATLDPERRYRLDLDKLDDGRTRESQLLAPTRWTLEMGNLVELALAFLVTR